jgi:hypothetical protein
MALSSPAANMLDGGAVQLSGAVQAEQVRNRVDGDEHAEVGDEPALVAEGQPADPGVDPVGADDQVEPALWGMRERHLHPVRLLVQAGDLVAEKVFGAGAGGVVQNLCQIAAEDLHVAGEDPARHGRPRGAVGGDIGEVAHVRLALLDRVQHAHLAQHAEMHVAAEVHGVAAAAQVRCALDHGRPEAVSVEPVGQRGSGDAGAGDENVHDRNYTFV